MTAELPASVARGSTAADAYAACATVIALVACQAPPSVPIPRPPPDHTAVWVATFEENRVEVYSAESKTLDVLAGAFALEWASFPSTTPPPLGRQPAEGVPSVPLGLPTAVLGLSDGGFVPVEREASVSSRLRLPCTGDRLQRVGLPAIVDDTAVTLVPFGADQMLLTANPVLRREDAGPCSRGCVEKAGAIGLLTPPLFEPLTHPDLADRSVRPAHACSDPQGGAWLLDGELQLFRVRPGGTLVALGQVDAPPGRDIVVSELSCWPSLDDPDEPALFIRNFDFDVYYVPPNAGPGSRLARLTDTRVRRFEGLRYADENGMAIDRRVGVGVDTSIFEATGVDTLRVQFWTAAVYELRIEPTPIDPLRTSTTAPPIRLTVFDPGWVVPRSVRATTSRGWTFILYQTYPTPGVEVAFPRQHLLRFDPNGQGPVFVPDADLDARLLLGFRDLVLGTKDSTARLFSLRPDGTLDLCATIDIDTTPNKANIARGGLAVLGGTDGEASLIGLRLGR